MPQVTRDTLVAQTREYADAVGSDRWSDGLILVILDQVFDSEWSNILNAAPYYTFAQRTVMTDLNGQIPFSALNGGGGDNQENFYRMMSLSDGNRLYVQTKFTDVPMGTVTNYLPTYPKQFYQAGQAFQTLPVESGNQLFAFVNWKPTAIRDLANGSSVVEFPNRAHLIVVWEAAANMLMKGGAESRQALDLKGLAAQERASMLDDIRRTTTRPTEMNYPDQKSDWAGG
jgi:hypothetical protein